MILCSNLKKSELVIMSFDICTCDTNNIQICLLMDEGVWFLHCHLEVHTTWGLKMAFIVDNGKGPNESLIPPPADLPKC